MYDLDTNTVCRDLVGHTKPSWCILLDTTNTTLYTGSVDTTVGVWDLRTSYVTKLTSHQTAIHSIFIDNNRIISGAENNELLVWDKRKTVYPVKKN